MQSKPAGSPVAEDLDRMSDASIGRLRRMASDTQVPAQSSPSLHAPVALALYALPGTATARLVGKEIPAEPEGAT